MQVSGDPEQVTHLADAPLPSQPPPSPPLDPIILPNCCSASGGIGTGQFQSMKYEAPASPSFGNEVAVTAFCMQATATSSWPLGKVDLPLLRVLNVHPPFASSSYKYCISIVPLP